MVAMLSSGCRCFDCAWVGCGARPFHAAGSGARFGNSASKFFRFDDTSAAAVTLGRPIVGGFSHKGKGLSCDDRRLVIAAARRSTITGSWSMTTGRSVRAGRSTTRRRAQRRSIRQYDDRSTTGAGKPASTGSPGA
ncbi:hypothetical protein [Burkholderia sola]|uniref:hypothetical protein n=1 Tax=Burkholderia sola TaxID=2843302 RepID=UPI0023DDA37F|nr:hypothetical protein [Burkholderia sola]